MSERRQRLLFLATSTLGFAGGWVSVLHGPPMLALVLVAAAFACAVRAVWGAMDEADEE